MVSRMKPRVKRGLASALYRTFPIAVFLIAGCGGTVENSQAGSTSSSGGGATTSMGTRMTASSTGGGGATTSTTSTTSTGGGGFEEGGGGFAPGGRPGGGGGAPHTCDASGLGDHSACSGACNAILVDTVIRCDLDRDFADMVCTSVPRPRIPP